MSNVPKLRFSEFDGEWEEKKLSELGEFKGGGTPSKKVSEYWEGNIPWISSSDIIENNIHQINITRFINENSINKSATKIIPKNSILFISRVGVGKLAINREELCTSQDFINFIPRIIDSYYLGYYFLANRNTLLSFNQGTSIKGFTKNDISTLNLTLPKKPEQQKIANFLTSIDKKIELLESKITHLERYKKGLMQKIFSLELRFKGDAWKEKEYGDIYSFHITNSLSRDKLNYDDGIVKNIHYGDIHTKFSTIFDIEKEYVPFINEDVNLSKIKEESYCQEGDLVVADASEDYADIGKTIEIKNLNNEKLIAGLHTFLARPNKEQVSIGYMGYLLQSWGVRKQVMRIAQGSKVLSLSTKRLAKVKLDLPSLSEQQKIATFLSSIDKKIEQTQKALEEMKAFKKGLLQGMFV